MGRGENAFSFTFHWPPSKGNFSFSFHWPPSLEHSIGQQALDLPSPPFSFFFKGELGSLGGSLSSDIIFNLVLNIFFDKLFEEEKND